ncbi:MAG TPA: carboxypeptidase-like regulatory domain-containing protein [Pyrinomonadaceae bacterium]|nr:carboxypeptidase-like regulatory domain-containing protein [Pyrinomonadaceae bacterium]
MPISGLTRYLLVFGLLLGCAQLHGTVTSQTKSIKKTPTGTVSGRITLQGRGKGGIVIALNTERTGPQSGPLIKATSDADGNYRITDVPAGFYRVVPLAPDYVVPEVNLSSFGSRGKALNLAEGETVNDVDFSITRGAVITGKVTYSDGRPVIEERISIAPVRQDPVGPFFNGALSFQTDDRGVYRIFGLAAGQYKISVGQPAEGSVMGIGRGRPVLERVFYPDVSDVNEAKIIELSEGGEAANIDITVGRSLRGFTAVGLVLDGETNQPVTNLRLGLQRVVGQPRAFVGASAVSDQRGEFRIENILPGKYAVSIMSQPNLQVQAESVSFDVIDQDVTGITVRTSKGASIAGTLVIEGTADKAVLTRIPRFQLQVYMQNEGNFSGGYQQAQLSPDGTFSVGGLRSGRANFILFGEDFAQPKGFSLARIELNGVVQARGLEVKPGEQISGVKVVFTYATGIVRGNVNIANGPLPIGARIMVRLAKTGEPSQGLRPQEADSRGHFVIEGVPAGSYELFVSTFIPGSRQRPPSSRQTVSVADGATIEVAVTLGLNPKRDPVPNP